MTVIDINKGRADDFDSELIEYEKQRDHRENLFRILHQELCSQGISAYDVSAIMCRVALDELNRTHGSEYGLLVAEDMFLDAAHEHGGSNIVPNNREAWDKVTQKVIDIKLDLLPKLAKKD